MLGYFQAALFYSNVYLIQAPIYNLIMMGGRIKQIITERQAPSQSEIMYFAKFATAALGSYQLLGKIGPENKLLKTAIATWSGSAASQLYPIIEHAVFGEDRPQQPRGPQHA